MALIGSFGKIFKVAAVTGGLLVFACSQARAAGNKLFTESWQDKETCKKVKQSGSVFHVCDVISAGKFTVKTTISGSEAAGLSPSILTSGSAVAYISLAPTGDAASGTGSVRGSSPGSSPGSGPSTLGYYYPGGSSNGTISTINGWTIKGNSKKATAKLLLYRPDCKKARFNYEKVELTITDKPELEVSISATTGGDSCDNWFADSIDADSFDGDPTTRIDAPNSLFLQIGFRGVWNYTNNNVSVTGSVKTKAGKGHAGSGTAPPELSDISIEGTL